MRTAARCGEADRATAKSDEIPFHSGLVATQSLGTAWIVAETVAGDCHASVRPLRHKLTYQLNRRRDQRQASALPVLFVLVAAGQFPAVY